MRVLPSAAEAVGAATGKVAGRGTLRVVLSWAVVMALLTYGVVMTLSTALKLFTG